IRDFHVTGVQTCALPISWLSNGNVGVVADEFGSLIHLMRIELQVEGQASPTKRGKAPAPRMRLHQTLRSTEGEHCIGVPVEDLRSEERRVGKECRYARMQ